MSEYTYNQNQNNPSGIWQHIWVTLTIQALNEYSQRQYEKCFKTLQLLKSQLPPECAKDVSQKFEQITKIIQTPVTGYNLQDAQEKRLIHITREIPTTLIELLGNITNSLYTHNWINKSFNVAPLSTKKPHIGGKQRTTQ